MSWHCADWYENLPTFDDGDHYAFEETFESLYTNYRCSSFSSSIPVTVNANDETIDPLDGFTSTAHCQTHDRDAEWLASDDDLTARRLYNDIDLSEGVWACLECELGMSRWSYHQHMVAIHGEDTEQYELFGTPLNNADDEDFLWVAATPPVPTIHSTWQTS